MHRPDMDIDIDKTPGHGEQVEAEAKAERATRDIGVIGASAGGVEALQRLVALLPADYCCRPY